MCQCHDATSDLRFYLTTSNEKHQTPRIPQRSSSVRPAEILSISPYYSTDFAVGAPPWVLGIFLFHQSTVSTLHGSADRHICALSNKFQYTFAGRRSYNVPQLVVAMDGDDQHGGKQCGSSFRYPQQAASANKASCKNAHSSVFCTRINWISKKKVNKLSFFFCWQLSPLAQVARCTVHFVHRLLLAYDLLPQQLLLASEVLRS